METTNEGMLQSDWQIYSKANNQSMKLGCIVADACLPSSSPFFFFFFFPLSPQEQKGKSG